MDNEAWVLSYREECFDQIGLKPSLRTPLFNGSLECELRKYQIFSGKFNDMRAGGGYIKTAQDRRLMADRKRFKQHREFNDKLEENPRERMRKPKRDDWEDKRDFKKGKGDRKDFRKEGGKKYDRGSRKSFDHKGGDKKYGKKRFFDNNDED